MKNVMLDLETMSSGPRAAIVQIGAVEFGLPNGIGSTFSRAVSLKSCTDLGLEIDGDTIDWWLQQDKEAQNAILTGRIGITKALEEFRDWWRGTKAKFIWANSPAFDCVILRNAYRVATGGRAPFHYRQERCCRTLWAIGSALGVNVNVEREGVRHDAAADAVHQALSMQAVVAELQRRLIG